jgi:copper oxidase (laccase) domain-containing protein
MSSPGADLGPGEPLLFDLPGGGHALFTTRAHGNMSSVGGAGAEHGVGVRERLRTQLGLRRLARGYQVHGTTILRIRADADIPTQDLASAHHPSTQADGQATDLHGVGAMVLTADCLPVALGANGAVAMVHAGWRGLAAGALEEGVRALRELSDALAGARGDTGERRDGGGGGEITAVIGPGAGPCCYEVGPEVRAVFGGAHRDGRGHIDLKAIARDRLLAAGGGVIEVLDAHACTICDERFFSYRREGSRAGRNAGVAWRG